MIQALYCHNGDHTYERDAKRGRVPTSCETHGGTGIVVRTYRSGSKSGAAALKDHGGPVKSTGVKTRDYRTAVAAGKPVTPLGPRKVPVKVVATEGDSTEDDGYPVEISLFPVSDYMPDTTPNEQVRLLQAWANKRTVTVDDDHAGQFYCERGDHWVARKSTRGRVPKVCDEHKADPEYQRVKSADQRTATANKGAETAYDLDEALKARGVHLSQQSDEFEVQYKWAGSWQRFLLLHGAQSRKLWLAKEKNKALVDSKRFRIVELTPAA